MIQPRSIVKIADNSGGKIGRIFKTAANTGRAYAKLPSKKYLKRETWFDRACPGEGRGSPCFTHSGILGLSKDGPLISMDRQIDNRIGPSSFCFLVPCLPLGLGLPFIPFS